MKALLFHCRGETPILHEMVFLGVKTKQVKTAQVGDDLTIYQTEDHYIFETTCGICGKKRKCWMTPSDESCDDMLDSLVLPENLEKVMKKLMKPPTSI